MENSAFFLLPSEIARLVYGKIISEFPEPDFIKKISLFVVIFGTQRS